jgi:transglutaminase/protease-like cytokinesis protein 3
VILSLLAFLSRSTLSRTMWIDIVLQVSEAGGSSHNNPVCSGCFHVSSNSSWWPSWLASELSASSQTRAPMVPSRV